MGTRRPAPERELWVFEDDGLRLRLARVRREGEDGVQLCSLQRVGEGAELLATLDGLREGGRGGARSAILVTHHARPFLDYVPLSPGRGTREVIEQRLERELARRRELDGDGELACGWASELPLDPTEDCRVSATAIGEGVRELWMDRLSRRGLTVEGIYPLIGAPLAALAEADAAGPLLALQIEEQDVTVLEVAGGVAHSIEIHERVQPTAQQCAELIGTGCPEVVLCGGGADLSELGYELARTSGTWVRILRPRQSFLTEGHRPATLAAVLGAASLAFGLDPVGSLAAVPPQI